MLATCPTVRRAAALGLWSIALVTAARAQEPRALKLIPAADARAHLDERCVVELTVRLVKHIPDRVYFLDSEADYRDPKNVAIVIAQQDVETFQKAGIDDPCDHYQGKPIRVTGTVSFESGQVRIRVNDPGQIQVIAAK